MPNKAKRPRAKKPVDTGYGLVSTSLPGLTWVDVDEPNISTLNSLKERFGFLSTADLRECLPPFQRPKLVFRDHYAFAILLFPRYDRKSGLIGANEIDFFIGLDAESGSGGRFLVTTHSPELRMISDLAERCSQNSKAAAELEGRTPADLASELVHRLIANCFPMLTHLSNDIDAAEKNIFRTFDDQAVREILRIKTNIVNFRKIMQGHGSVLRGLRERALADGAPASVRRRLDEIEDQTDEIIEFLANYKDTIDALHDSHASFVHLKASRTTETLTAIASVIFPTTLAASIFGMNGKDMPFMNSPGGFWFMLGAVFIVMVVTALALKSKKLM